MATSNRDLQTSGPRGFWTDKPTFVTGGSGLVGSWLVRQLAERGANLTCLMRDWVPNSELVRSGVLDRVRVVRGDVCDQALLERVLGEDEVEVVFHLAAQTTVPVANRNPVSTFDSNIHGTWALLEACRRSPTVRAIVVASSDKAYGSHDTLPYEESYPLRGGHPYDVSKSCCDLIAQSYATTYDLPVAITRCGNFFGGGDLNWNRIVPGTIRAVLRGERPVIRSDGSPVRDYFYVEDGAMSYALLAERLATDSRVRGEAFNFSNERPMTVLGVVARILEKMGRTDLAPDIRGEASHEIKDQYLSARKARDWFGWRPAFELDPALGRTIAWYRDFFGGTAA